MITANSGLRASLAIYIISSPTCTCGMLIVNYYIILVFLKPRSEKKKLADIMVRMPWFQKQQADLLVN